MVMEKWRSAVEIMGVEPDRSRWTFIQLDNQIAKSNAIIFLPITSLQAISNRSSDFPTSQLTTRDEQHYTTQNYTALQQSINPHAGVKECRIAIIAVI